jgi:hypothetical protein
LNLQEHPIPQSLDMQPALWETGDPALQRYAFFSFYRKILKNFDEGFLDQLTGYKSFWNVAGGTKTLKRWRHDYYEYSYILPRHSPGQGKGLPSSILAQSLWSARAGGLSEFYQNKLLLLRELIDEMERMDSLQQGAAPYLSFYAFHCRSFPCISAFALKDSPAGCEWVEGYADESPNHGLFFLRKANDMIAAGSPTGMVEDLRQMYWTHLLLTEGKLFELSKYIGLVEDRRLPRKDRFGKLSRAGLLSPILLLQFRLSGTPEESLVDFPYQDLKVGFQGYLHLRD